MEQASIKDFNVASKEDLTNKAGIIYAIVNDYDGKIHKVSEKERPNFARQNSLHPDDLSFLSCGKRKTAKGWTFILSECRVA